MTGRVTVLLSTFNGGRFLPAQLASLAAQTHPWTLLWRDDGSSDDTVAFMQQQEARQAAATGRLGVLGSFMALLRQAAAELPEDGFVAFCDQDDVWLPEKLARAAAAASGDTPVLYACRQVLVDEALQKLGESQFIRQCGFPQALTENVCGGCTIVLNASAARLVAASRPPASSIHDWWSYLVVAAAGGRIVHDDTAGVLYRQHRGNVVGAPNTRLKRAIAAVRRGPKLFMTILRDHIAALRAHDAMLSEPARAFLRDADAALHGGPWRRLRMLSQPALVRQTTLETAIFRTWFLIG